MLSPRPRAPGQMTLLQELKDAHAAARYLRTRIETHTLDEADGRRLTGKVISALTHLLEAAEANAPAARPEPTRRGLLTLLDGGRA